ncbi:hypothetical protein QMP28_14210 [[Clostridium] symbiosum]|uniref:hypothetical protein n=2 Tax=Clostridium symbiosum TaxID=1512 RepID=UPI00331307D2
MQHHGLEYNFNQYGVFTEVYEREHKETLWGLSMYFEPRQQKEFFDKSEVEAVIKLVIPYNPDTIMVIKSTISFENGYELIKGYKHYGTGMVSVNTKIRETEETWAESLRLLWLAISVFLHAKVE